MKKVEKFEIVSNGDPGETFVKLNGEIIRGLQYLKLTFEVGKNTEVIMRKVLSDKNKKIEISGFLRPK